MLGVTFFWLIGLSFAQTYCVPAGLNSSGTELLNLKLGLDYNYTVPNNKKFNMADEPFLVDENYIDFDLDIDNNSSDPIYIGYYLDWNLDGTFTPMSELLFSQSSSGSVVADQLLLTNDMLEALTENDLRLRVIMTDDENDIQNPCNFPSFISEQPYQVIDVLIRRRIKIKKCTADTDGPDNFDCLQPKDNFIAHFCIQNAGRLVNFQSANLQLTLTAPFQLPLETCPDVTLLLNGGEYPNISIMPPYAFNFTNIALPFEDGDIMIPSSCWQNYTQANFQMDIVYEINGFNHTVSWEDDYDINACQNGYPSSSSFVSAENTNAQKEGLHLKTSENNEVQIFPNPVNDRLELNFQLANDEDVIINIYDVTGKKMQSTIIDNPNDLGNRQKDFSVAELPAGYYILGVFQEGKNIIQEKFIKL